MSRSGAIRFLAPRRTRRSGRSVSAHCHTVATRILHRGAFIGTMALATIALEEGIGTLAGPALTIEAGSSHGEDLDRLFKADRDLDCVIIVAAGGRPTHLVTREHYYAATGGPYGFTLYQKRPAELVGKPSPLVVEAAMPVRRLTPLALARPREDQYDPVIVTSGDGDGGKGSSGEVLGIVTIRRLVQRAAELEVQIAQLSNPLTQLPGSRLAQQWIEEGLAADRDGGLTVAFADLDRFKEINDVYGLLAGDEMVRCTARVLTAALPLLGDGARLSHAGGDDFLIVAPRPIPGDALREVCARFDREKLDLFPPDDLQRGFFYATAEPGNRVRVPLTTLSLAVITSRALGSERHPAVFSQRSTRLRRTAKALTTALGRSGFVADDGWPEAAL